MSNISKSTPAPTMNPEMGELQSLQTALCDMLRDSITDMEGNLEQLQTHRKLLSEVYKPYKKKADALSAKYRYTEYMRESEVIRTQEVRKTQLYFNARNLINRFIREIHTSTESQFSVLVNTQQDQTDSTVGGVDDVRTSLSQQNEIVDILAIDKESHDSAKCSSSDTNNRADRERLPSIPSLEDTNPPSQKEVSTPPPLRDKVSAHRSRSNEATTPPLNISVANTQHHKIEEVSTPLHEIKRGDKSPLKITEVSMPQLDEFKVNYESELKENPTGSYIFRNTTGVSCKIKVVSNHIPSSKTTFKNLGIVESHRSPDSGRPPEWLSEPRQLKGWPFSLGRLPDEPPEL